MLAAADKSLIQQAYRSWLEGRELQPRWGQKEMIAEIARVLARAGDPAAGADEVIAAIEAGTGTGKTIAYLLPALVLAKSLGRHLVVSTATVSLQEQLIDKDLPDLQRNTDLEFDYALAKGRGRYACKAKLVALTEQQQAVVPGLGFYPDEPHGAQVASDGDSYREMRQALESGEWSGDRDHWRAGVDNRLWKSLTSDHLQCTGRRCPQVRECPYLTAREGLDGVVCIVANHDLVLADLALGGGVVLPPPEQTLYIFDEAHQLPGKAQQHFGHRLRLAATGAWIDQVEKALPALAAEFGADSVVPEQVARAAPFWGQLRSLIGDCLSSCQSLLDREPAAGEGAATLRFPLHELPVELSDHAHNIGVCVAGLAQSMERIGGRLDDLIRGESSAATREAAERWYGPVGQISGRLKAIAGLAGAYAGSDADADSPSARWLASHRLSGGVDVEMCAMPLLPHRLLREMLWNRCAASILTSASLVALGSFARIIGETGIPESSRCRQLASPFNHYEAAELCIPAVAADPGNGPEYTAMLCQQLPTIIAQGAGTLVLFSARRQMQAVYEAMPAALQCCILNQDQLGKLEIFRRHRQAVDDGERSIIFGLASFAEGIDLPGEYCSHVVITRLPFAVPDDPIEATLAEWVRLNGGHPFRDVALPDAARRLVQASGRLLRTEHDRGRITVLDKRLVTRRYGSELLQSLPNYRLVTGAQAASALA